MSSKNGQTTLTNVHILATCHNDALWDATSLVFKTLRVGFPTADVTVWMNGLDAKRSAALKAAVLGCGVRTLVINEVAHDRWVAGLLEKSPQPFWICDTDIIFFDRVEGRHYESAALAGRYEPSFVEPWSKTHKAERLHTSLLYLNPTLISNKVREWMGRWHPKNFPFTPQVEMVAQYYVPQLGEAPIFFDTCAGLYQAIGGYAFDAEENAYFEHLHCGIYSDLIAKALPGIGDVHRAVFQDVNAARGLHEQQSKYYQDHAIL